jgi:hypothetical protein
MRNPLSTPLAVERSDRRAPLLSVTMEAVTPAPALLILSRRVCSVSAAFTSTTTAPPPTVGTKVIGGASSQAPSSMVRVPLPTRAEPSG